MKRAGSERRGKSPETGVLGAIGVIRCSCYKIEEINSARAGRRPSQRTQIAAGTVPPHESAASSCGENFLARNVPFKVDAGTAHHFAIIVNESPQVAHHIGGLSLRTRTRDERERYAAKE